MDKYYKEYHIYFNIANKNSEEKGNKVQAIIDSFEKHIKLAESNIDGYSYWGSDSDCGIHKMEYSNYYKRPIIYEDRIKRQKRFQALFYIGEIKRIYAVADIIDIEEYRNKKEGYSNNIEFQVKDEKTGEPAKHKYWYKLKNFKLLSSSESNHYLEKLYFESKASIEKNSGIEQNLKDKFNKKYGSRPDILAIYRYCLDSESIEDELLQTRILNFNFNTIQDTHYQKNVSLNLPEVRGHGVSLTKGI